MAEHSPSLERIRPCHVALLPLKRVVQVYPLVQSALPGTLLEDWIDYASALVHAEGSSAPSGILAAERPRGCVAGLCAFQGRRDLAHGRILQVELLIVLSLFDEARIAAALASEIECTARRLGCAAIHCLLPEDGANHAQKALQAFGHRLEARVYCKAIAGPDC